MQVRDIASQRPILSVEAGEDLALANQIMLWAEIRHLPVLSGGALVGVLSASDLLRRATRGGWRDSLRAPVKSAMSAPAQTISPDEDVAEAAARMAERRIGCLPVVSDGAIVGMLTRTDLLALEARQKAPPEPWSDVGVRAVMRANPATVQEDDDLVAAVARLQRDPIRHLPVVNGDRRVIGMLSDQDVRSALGGAVFGAATGADVRARLMKVARAMTAPAVTVPETASLALAAGYFMDHRVAALPVVDLEDRLVGVVTYLDMLAAAYKPSRQGMPI